MASQLTSRASRWWPRTVGRLATALPPGRIDWTLLAAVAALSGIGMLLVYAATYTPGDAQGAWSFLERHALHLVCGAVACVVAAAVDYRIPRAYAPVVFLAAVVGLALVLTPLGEVINGSRSWIVVAGVQMQPAELAKIALVIATAMLLGEPRDGETAPTSRDVLFSLAALAVPMGLVLAQPDIGTAMILGAIYLGMLTMSGAPIRWIVGLLSCGALSVAAVWWFGLLESYQVARFTSFMDPQADPRGTGYNATQAMISVGSGGLNGTGYLQGEQTSGRFVPEQHTDFIFTVVGEEFGFIGSASVIVLFALVVWRVLRTAANCQQPYARLVCVGIGAWLFTQVFVNVGMTLGIMPITGLPLPFVSYGGTATVSQLLAVGLVLGINARHRGFE